MQSAFTFTFTSGSVSRLISRVSFLMSHLVRPTSHVSFLLSDFPHFNYPLSFVAFYFLCFCLLLNYGDSAILLPFRRKNLGSEISTRQSAVATAPDDDLQIQYSLPLTAHVSLVMSHISRLTFHVSLLTYDCLRPTSYVSCLPSDV